MKIAIAVQTWLTHVPLGLSVSPLCQEETGHVCVSFKPD